MIKNRNRSRGEVDRGKKNKIGSLTPPMHSMGVGAPPPHQLDFYTHTFFGTAFYSFRPDWERAFVNLNDQAAKPGDRVKEWKNSYMSGKGAAQVPRSNWDGGMYPPMMDGYFWRVQPPEGLNGYPTLVEKTYSGKPHRGLLFEGPQYLQIDGSEVKDYFNLPDSPLFSTGGTDLMAHPYTDSGATFLFVLDNYHIPDSINEAWMPGPYIPTYYQGRKNAIETLLLSKQLGENEVGMSGPDVCVSAVPGVGCYEWPRTEDLGVQFFNQGTAWSFEDAPSLRRSNWGPDAATKQPGWTGTSQPVYNRNPLSNYPYVDSVGHSLYGDFENHPQMDGIKRMLPDGLQVVILEYNNQNKTVFTANPVDVLDIDATGPTVSIYAIGEGWATGDLDVPKLRSAKPAVANHTLWDRENIFIGGSPPWLGNSNIFSEYINGYWGGFTGVIFEVQMFEGVLNDHDKRSLGRIYIDRYGSRIE